MAADHRAVHGRHTAVTRPRRAQTPRRALHRVAAAVRLSQARGQTQLPQLQLCVLPALPEDELPQILHVLPAHPLKG
ncbi:MAG: hypothetical protein CMP58_03510 [Flavobacteriales bacterium]|nr:hypothetical protein [Flavobacteriales bacterium]